MLKIRRITIKNYRQLEDIELKFLDDTGLFIFIGKNGIGKSNFLNAICWCLYEKQPFKSVRSDDTSFDDNKILNWDVAHEDPNAEIRVEMEVSMDGNIYFFKRNKYAEQDAKLTVMRKVDSEWVEIDQPNIIVNNFLPESVRDFFMFDGEDIKELFEGNYAENIKEGIWRISRVKLLDRSIEHLTKIGNELRREFSKEMPDEKIKEKEYSALIERIEKNEKLRTLKSVSFKELKSNLVELHKKESHFEKYRNMHDRRDESMKLLESANKRKVDYQSDINTLIVTLCPFYYIQEILVEIRNVIKKDTKKGQIPASIKAKFIEDLIAKKECICGNDIVKGHSEYDKLTVLLNEVTPMDGREILLKDDYFIDDKSKELEGFRGRLGILREKCAGERVTIDKYERIIGDIKEQLKNAPDQEVGNLENTIQKYEEQTDDIQREIGGIDSEVKADSNRANELKKEIDALISRKASNKKMSGKYSLINNSIDKLSEIREKLINGTRVIVSKNTNQFFMEMIWEDAGFMEVKFDSEYNIIISKEGLSEAMPVDSLSQGQIKVLAYATLKALAKISGFAHVPVFIDAPLETLDTDVRKQFLDLLPNFMPEKQVFIFSVDDPAILEFAKNNVKKDNFYHVVKDDEKSTSTKIINYIA